MRNQNAKARSHKIGENHVVPVYVTGPADISFTANGRATKLRLDPYHAYIFIPDQKTGLRLEGLELPGEMLERDTRAELNPIPRDPPVKVPVTLLVDDCDPRADKFWQAELRKRFDEAAEVIEKASGIRLEFAGFDTWKSDANAANVSELLTGFENAVKVKEGSLAVGYSSRRIDDKMNPEFGVNRGLGSRHILLREWRPKGESERVEVLTHFLSQALGGVGTPDPGSALRPKLADGYLNRPGSVLRLDPLNALALNLWADERRREPVVGIAILSPVNKHRLTRVYKALLKAAPGDSLALAYLDDLDRDFAKEPNPMPKKPDRPGVKLGVRDELVRKIVKRGFGAGEAERSARCEGTYRRRTHRSLRSSGCEGRGEPSVPGDGIGVPDRRRHCVRRYRCAGGGPCLCGCNQGRGDAGRAQSAARGAGEPDAGRSSRSLPPVLPRLRRG